MNDTTSPRPRAACVHAVCLRAGALVTACLALATVACASLPALAAAHGRRTAPTRGARRHAARLAFARRRTLVAVSHERGLALTHRVRRLRAPRQCVDAGVRIDRVSRLRTDRATLCLLNRQRMRRGLPGLRLNSRLDRSAQTWTNTMVHEHSFSHGSDFGSRISAAGFDWSQIGENIADGYRTPAGAVKAWMASTGHCQNILDPDFREVGAGFALGSAMHGGAHGTWTTDFGLLMGQRALSNSWRPAEGCPYG